MKRLGRLISLLTASAMTVSAFAGTPAGAYIDHTADLPENCFYLAVEDRNSIFDGRRIITQCDAGEYVEIALYANEVPVLSDLSLSIRGDSSFNITRYRNNYFREASFETEDDREYQYSFSMGRNVSIPNDEILAWLDVELPYSVGMYTFSVTVEDAREQNGDPVPWRTVDLEIKIDGGGYVVSSYTTPYSTTAGTTISTTSSGSATTPSTTSSSKTTTSASTTTSTTRTTAPPVTMSSTTTTASSIVEITETNTELITFDTELTTTTTTTEETTVTISETSAETTAAASSEETTVSTSASSDTKPYYAKNATIQILPVPDSQDYTVESLISENRIYADYGDEIVLGLYPEGVDATSGYLLYWDCSDVDFIGAEDYPTGSTLLPTFNARYANKADSFGQKYVSAVAAASSKSDLMPNAPLVVFRISVPQKDDSRGSRYDDDYVAFSITETNCRVEMVDSNGFTTVKTRYSSFLDENERDVLSQIIPTRIMVKDILVTTSYSMSYGGGPGTESNTTDTKPYYAKNATIQILPVPDSQDYTVESLISENRIYADYGDEIVLGLYPEGIDATSGYLLYWDCSDVDFIGAVDYPTGSTLSPTFNARYANKADSFGQKYLSAVAAASSKCELMQNEPLVVFRISVPQKDDSRGSRYGDYVAFSITETNCRVEMVDSNGFTTVKTRYSSFLDENERDVLSQIIPTRIMVKDILVTTSYSMSYGGGPGTESNTTESSGTTDSIWTEATTTSFSDTTDSESAETTTTSELPASPGANVTSTTASAEANPTETDLPQTGVGSPAGLLTVCGSLTLIAAGAYVLQHTKRRDEEAE